MKLPKRLIEGYGAFRQNAWPSQHRLYESLAHGQAPAVMVIACADSRVDPATIFHASPGELFIVRNVANIVPPFEEDEGRHGTSAAIEFAVEGLEVAHIVVLGHARCGGIKACLDAVNGRPPGRFIGPWVTIASEAREEVLTTLQDAPEDVRQQALEQVSIRHSLKYLESFSFVRRRVAAGRLHLHGGWFSIASGELHALDPETGAFTPLEL